MIGNGVGIDRVMRCRRLHLRDWGGDQFRARAMLVLQLALAISP